MERVIRKYGKWSTSYGVIEDWAEKLSDGRWVLENGHYAVPQIDMLPPGNPLVQHYSIHRKNRWGNP